MKRKRKIKKYRSLAEHRMTKILEELASGLEEVVLQLKLQQLQMGNDLERIKLSMNYEKKDNQQTI